MSASSDPAALALDRYGSGEPLVLIHGLGTNRRVWSEVASALARRLSAIAIDLPGFGDSPPAGEGFALDQVADHIHAGLREQPPYDLLGHSLGGAIALTLARRHPERVRRLILSAPAGFRTRPRPLAQALGAVAPALLRGRRIIGGPLVQSPTARRALLWGALHDARGISATRARSMLEASRGASRLGEATEAALQADLASDLEALDCPVGLIWGERDPLMPEATTDAIRSHRPDAPVEVIPDAGHVVQLERPEQFAEAVDRLLNALADRITVS